MNKSMYDKLKLQTIGMDCFYESISTSINYLGMDYLALLYTIYNLFYNYNDFINISIDRSPEEYLCTGNKLMFNIRPLTWLKYIYGEYFYNNTEDMDLFKYLKDIKSTKANKDFLIELKSKYLDSDISVMIPISAAKLKQEYLNIGGDDVLGDNSFHYINLIDVNEEYCTIVDTNFKVKGEISTNSFINSLGFSNNLLFKYIDPAIKNCEIGLIKLLKNNLKNAISSIVNIDGKKYNNNIEALKSLINDLPQIIDVFESTYGIYAPQFLSLSFMPQRHIIRSCGYLYSNLYNECKMELLKEIGNLSSYSGDLWFNFDHVLDKTFLKNEKLTQKKDNLCIILNKILENDKKTIETMSELYNKL